jgi:hypothetical protein
VCKVVVVFTDENKKILWIQHVNRMPRNRLPRVMKHYFSTGRRNYGRTLGPVYTRPVERQGK